MTEAYERWLEQALTPETIAQLRSKGVRLPQNPSNADLVALALGRRAQRGDPVSAKELREGVQGKAPMALQVLSDAHVEIEVTFEPAPPALARANKPTEKVIDVEVEQALPDAAQSLATKQAQHADDDGEDR